MRGTTQMLRLLVLTTFVPVLASAQGWIERPMPLPGGSVERMRSSVSVTISGQVGRVSVEEWFHNSGPRLEEGSYLYPLPGEATFSGFSLWQGDQELHGETMDGGRARAIYDSIVRQRRDPALIELAGHGLLRARVFPINPGETRRIALRYTQMLDRVGDAWRFRFAAGSAAMAGRAPRSLRLTVDSAARFGEPYSPTHQLRATRHGGMLEVTLADTLAAGDVEVFLPLTSSRVGLTAVTRAAVGEDGYFMLLLNPGRGAETAMPQRDLVAVLDVSGSMSGQKIDQAKAALRQLLSGLRPQDRFRLIAFSNDVRRYRAAWTQGSADELRQATGWIDALGADGGTNIAGALHEAFALPPSEAALGVTVFLTDGMPTVGESDPERIAATAESERGRFRVFAFGIGYDVNTYLLDRLTERARGLTEYVPPGGDVEMAVGDLAGKIASPVLTDLTLTAGAGLEVYDLQPGSIPDLFAGQELVLFGRYRGTGAGARVITLSGRRGDHAESFGVRLSEDADGGPDYVERLWAARKAGSLSREIRLHGETPELRDALKALALRYGLLTEYTSYLVTEPMAVIAAASPIVPRNQAASGAPAVARAEEDRNLASSKSLVQFGDAQSGVISFTRNDAVKQIGARIFHLINGVWTDRASGDSLRVVRVAPFSDAYVALLRALPELVSPATLQPAVLVAGRRVSVKIEAGGVDHWDAGALDALVRDFR